MPEPYSHLVEGPFDTARSNVGLYLRFFVSPLNCSKKRDDLSWRHFALSRDLLSRFRVQGNCYHGLILRRMKIPLVRSG